jgi:putative ABC transport system permease protein
MSDLRYAIRSFRRAPAFALLAVLTLALGVGANTAIFAVVDAVLLRPLPYPEADRVVTIVNRWQGSPEADLSPAEYFDYREQTAGFEAVAAYSPGALVITGGEQPERVPAGFASASLFRVLGVSPRLGRAFTAEEDRPDASPVAVLTDAFWRSRFGADPSVIGTTITLNAEPATIVGVMPAGFRVPADFGGADPAAVFVPLGIDRSTVPNRGSHFLEGYARLAPGTSLDAADDAIAAVADRFVRQFTDAYPADMAFGVSLVPLRETIVGPVRRALLVLLGAVGFVLLIACANVAALVLSRADARRRELAVRAALGAGRRRLLRQLVVESLVLAAAGGAVGVLLAAWATGALIGLTPPDIPRLEAVGIDLRVVGFAVLATLATALLFGLAPALQASRLDLYGSLREGGRGGTGGRAAGRVRGALVIAEIALALLLLAGAGLLGRSFLALSAVDPGYETENVLTFRISLPSASYPETAEVIDLVDRFAQRLTTLPGARAAGAVTNLPLTGSLGDLNFYPEGRIIAEGGVSPRADWQVVTPGYFDAVGMRVLRGRAIGPEDHADAPGVVVISRSLAARFWPGEDPIGQRFTLGGGAGPGVVSVVGIAEDVRHAALSNEPRPEMYLPHAQFRFWNTGEVVRSLTFAVGTAGAPASLAAGARSALSALDPSLPMSALQTMEQVRAASVARPRFLAALLAVFAAVALVLAAVGVYGVMAYAVSRRTQEVGIRVALGARPADVLRLVVAQGMVLALAGIAIGLAGALALSRVLASLLFRTAPTDPLTLAAVSVGLAAVALMACWIPARRATTVDPLVALRAE